jgi:AcrR family transcriptional regulator
VKYTKQQGYRMRARAEGMADTRERILRAMLKLGLEQAYEDITLASIAREARVSHQTVLNHFDSKEGVAGAAAEILSRETSAARSKAVPGDVASAIRVLVGEYERFGDANVRWALTAERLGSLAPLLDRARADHQTWLARTFGAALPTATERRTRVIHGLHAATDVYTWKLLRRDLRLTQDQTEAIMANLVDGILDERSSRQSRRRSRKKVR